MYAMGRARVRREFATGGSGLLRWGLFGGVVFSPAITLKSCTINRKRQSETTVAKQSGQRPGIKAGANDWVWTRARKESESESE